MLIVDRFSRGKIFASKKEPTQKMKKNDIKIRDIEDKICIEGVFHACDSCKVSTKIVTHHDGF